MAAYHAIARCRLQVAAALLLALSIGAAGAHAHHLDDELTEPIFTERAFVENNLEIDGVYETADDGDALELSAEANWVIDERLQLGAEVPVGFTFPDDDSNQAALSDIALSTQFLVCCEAGGGLDYLSLRAEVALPTGDREHDIGGDGAIGASVIAGRLVTLSESLPDLGIQLQLGYEQQLRLSDEQRDTASQLGLSKTREKDLIWNLALTQNYSQWRIQPVLELLGTTTYEGLENSDEGTIVEIGGGFWWTPFPGGKGLKSLDLALGAKGPVTSRKESDLTAVLYLDWSF